MSKCLINYDLIDIVDHINGGDILPIGDSSYDIYEKLKDIDVI